MKIAIYLTHDETMGEVIRARSIARRLAKTHEVMMFQAGVVSSALENETSFEVVNLPHPYENKYSLKKVYNTLDKKRIGARLRVLIDKTTSFDPDVFLTISFPFTYADCIFELLPYLSWVNDHRPNMALVCSLGYPLSRTQPEKLTPLLPKYDLVMVHCPKELDLEYIKKRFPDANVCKVLNTLEKENRAVFTNYILPDESQSPTQIDNPSDVFICRGSGVFADHLMIQGIQAARQLGQSCHVLTGPSGNTINTTSSVKITQYMPQKEVTAHLAAAEFTISMAGYGTATQLLYLRKAKSVLVTKSTTIDTEQVYRAAMLHDLLGSATLTSEEADTEALANALKQVEQNKPPENIKDEWFSGLDVVENIFTELEQKIKKKELTP